MTRKDFLNITNYCSGCGACSYKFPQEIKIQMNELGMYKAQLVSKRSTIPNINSICPFSGKSQNEWEIGESLFSKSKDILFNKVIGYYHNLYAGHVKVGSYREKGSSGGMVSWLLDELIDRSLIDGVIHVSATNSTNKLFEYSLSFSKEEIRKKSKSRYYPIDFSKILYEVTNKYPNYRFAFVGVPCFIKAIRLLQKEDLSIKEQIPYTIGLVCGHLKSTAFAQSFAWQSNIDPFKIKAIDFRHTEGNHLANQYFVKTEGEDISSKKEVSIIKQNKSFFGFLWGEGFFKYNCCDYCDDVFAETADITLGDAWLPQYVSDSMGTNIVVIRNEQLKNIIQEKKTDLNLNELSAEDIISSQDAGYRHKQKYIAYRIYKKQRSRVWVPLKRITPDSASFNKKTKKLIEYREILSKKSHIEFRKALNQNDFNYFKNNMTKVLTEYYRYYSEKSYNQIILEKYTSRMMQLACNIKQKLLKL